ncbi:MAG: hypothetical protein A3H28_09120 [Acidobacteria bacterium RIFCSPLOWO2_02_FULL_61_28]|nr:MAG: hypothetical protein A3H28_09120 [Acidobacteria bacterium RIFCSPLOWO2_02_FULL_61_28]
MAPSLLERPKIAKIFSRDEEVILHQGDALTFLKSLPSGLASLVITSPPYNLGKEYERKKALQDYLQEQTEVINELVRVLRNDGSICWEIGNFVEDGEVYPLDSYFYRIFKEKNLRLGPCLILIKSAF